MLEQLEQLAGSVCPQCEAAVRTVLDQVRAGQAAEAAAQHDANKAAAENAVQTMADAVAVLRGGTK